MTLTPAEKTALLDLYKKAYPAFYAREIEREAAGRGAGIVAWMRRGLRVVGWVVVGVLAGMILIVLLRMVSL